VRGLLFAALAASVVTLWFALEFALLIAISQEPDPISPLLKRSRFRVTRERLNNLSNFYPSGVKSPTAPFIAIVLISIIGIVIQCALAIPWSDPIFLGAPTLAIQLVLAVAAVRLGAGQLLIDP
jgi:hypothetical protein